MSTRGITLQVPGALAQARRELLVTGCGRSGTKYTAMLLQRLGLDIPHERVGRDGAASWYMAVDSVTAPFGVGRRGVHFEQVCHLVRHPLAVIASAATFKRQSWEFICRHVDISMQEPLLLRCAKYWYFWNLETEKIAHWRCRVEEKEQLLVQLRERLRLNDSGKPVERPAPDMNTRARGRAFHWYQEICERLRVPPNEHLSRWLATRPRTPPVEVSWDNLRALDADLTRRIRAKADEYGYPS